ncbi:hypothetical protein WR25_07922 [Diploscapter pachys]|uniref:Receptor ligand binding region domain-containing protein n=1 Tax=Diploscapter pachys TaxID=2018661 RepID=A0A2A2L0H5_9BILA|nr:hypothetical protein WR25_07922 [Diploscapter pachys]
MCGYGPSCGYAPRPAPDPNKAFYECCLDRQVPDACLNKCNFQSYNKDALSRMYFKQDACPMEAMTTLQFCAAQGRDHTECCARNGVTTTLAGTKCLLFCDQRLVGLICASNESTSISQFVGWNAVAPAVDMAWTKIVQEGLLPQYTNMSMEMSINDCSVAFSSGALIEFIKRDFDIVLGPACTGAMQLAGTVAKVYDFPVIYWGPPYNSVLLNQFEYPTVLTTSPCILNSAQAVLRLLNRYQWTDIALVYYVSRSDDIPRCSLIANDIEDQVNGAQNTTIVYRRQLTNITNSTFRNMMVSIKEVTRVVIICVEGDSALREFLIAATQEGMDSEEYVYISIEGRRGGTFRNVWNDPTIIQLDGREDLALRGARRLLSMDFQSLNDTDGFFSEVEDRLKLPPYNCAKNCTISRESSQAALLADAMMLYAYALNKSAAAGIPNPTGSQLADNARVTFQGFTGQVVINSNGTRNPIYVIYCLDQNDQSQAVLRITNILDNSTASTIVELQPDSIFWANRGGVKPLNKPKCGYGG